jgi:iron complex transport system substrate-binding protein
VIKECLFVNDRPQSRIQFPAAFSPDRRQLLLLAAGGASAFLFARSVGAQSTPEGGWSFTDDKNNTIELDAFPERLVIDVNAAAPLWDFGIRPVAVFGWNANENGDFGPAGGRIDSTGIDVVGDTSEPIKLEKLVAADPDLIITIAWTADEPTEYWSIDVDVLPQVQAIAPLLALSVATNAGTATERFAELAVALGADLDTPELDEQRARFAEAQEALQAATAETSDVRVLFIGVQDENIYIANPVDWADLMFYRELGLNIIDPEVAVGDFWETVSYEQANKYPADVLMVSTRPAAVQGSELADIPTFATHPAVVAGQVYGWNQDFILSHQGMAEALEHVTESITGTSVVNS